MALHWKHFYVEKVRSHNGTAQIANVKTVLIRNCYVFKTVHVTQLYVLQNGTPRQ
jgi:hypothetical protein